MNMLVQIKNPDVNVYRDSTQSQVIGHTYAGYKVAVSKVSEDKQYYYSEAYEGWIAASNFRILFEDYEGESNKLVPQPKEYTSIFDDSDIVTGSVSINNTSIDKVRGSDILGVFAMPYQFMSSVDRRISETGGENKDGVGRKYMDKIFARGNLLYLTPGKQDFLAGASESEKQGVFSALAGVATGGGLDMSIDGILKQQCRYYSLEPDPTSYFKYVDTACAATAELMGIGGERVTIGDNNNKEIRSIQWQRALSSNYKSAMGFEDNIVFYMDGYNQVSEDFGNATRESSLVSTINGYSDTVKEINYIMSGDTTGAKLGDMLSDGNFDATMSGIQSAVNSFTSGQGVLGAILGNATTVLSGGKLVFPELWSDSDYDRSYTIDIKLRSPDADDVSIFLNIIVPYIHLMALTAPRDFDGKYNSNGYVAPFLVRAYCRSMFNIDMGVITSLSVTKGGEGNWVTNSGLPTSIDISLSIKDLYKSLYISKGTGTIKDSAEMAKFVANDSEMEQLMTLAGVETKYLNFEQRLSLYNAMVHQSVSGLVTRPTDKIRQDIGNFLVRHGLTF